MNVRPHITEAISAFPKAVSPDMVSRACSVLGISPTEFCEHFAKEVTRAYLDRELSWSDADGAMNTLSGFFFRHLPQGAPFPEYAFGVFLAFDAGEVLEKPENERMTREQLANLHAKA